VGEHLEGKDNNLSLAVVLHTGVAVGLETREGRERDLLLPRILCTASGYYQRHDYVCLALERQGKDGQLLKHIESATVSTRPNGALSKSLVWCAEWPVS
jgi:hypothetical protein